MVTLNINGNDKDLDVAEDTPILIEHEIIGILSEHGDHTDVSPELFGIVLRRSRDATAGWTCDGDG